MFCNNCGNKLPDGSAFCHVCGAKIIQGEEPEHQPAPIREPAAVPPAASRTETQSFSPNPPAPPPIVNRNVPIMNAPASRKKSILPFVIIGIVIFVIILIAVSGAGRTDYVAMMKAHDLILDFPGTTLGEVTDKYLDDPSWSAYVSDGTQYVRVKGGIIGIGIEFTAIFMIRDDPDVQDQFLISSRSVKLDEETYSGDDALGILYMMFQAYDLNYPTIAQYVS